MAISRQKEARSRDYALLVFWMTSRVLYSAQYHRQHCTLYAFEQFGALYMHNHDDKYLSRPGFEPGTPRLQGPVDTNEPSKSAWMQLPLLCIVLSCLVLSCLVLSCLVLSCLVLSCLVLSLSCLVLSCLVLSCLVLSCLVLSCLVLSCLILSCLVFTLAQPFQCGTVLRQNLTSIDVRFLPLNTVLTLKEFKPL